MKRTYLVRVVDPNTGEDQRILVRSETPDGMQALVERPDLDPPLKIKTPVVISVKLMPLKRPLPKTNLSVTTA